MSLSALHRCQNCGYETDITNTLGVFEDTPYCRQCGLSASEGDAKMHDELAAMMAQNLNLNALPPHEQNMSMPTTPQVLPQPTAITYVSQHYHHSAHQVASTDADTPSVSAILAAAGVDSSALLPSQIQLFRHAGPEQQLRLMELWRIAPPTYGNQFPANAHPDNWPQTSMDQEEEAARSRWERMEQERYKNLSAPQAPKGHAEPYIVHGYDLQPATTSGQHPVAGYKAAEDPIGNSREWWRVSDMQPMEHQYGLLLHMRMYGQQLDQSGEGHDEEML